MAAKTFKAEDGSVITMTENGAYVLSAAAPAQAGKDEPCEGKDEKPKDGEEQDNDKDDDDDMEGKGKKSKSAASVATPVAVVNGRSDEDIVAISNLCRIAGKPEAAAEYLVKRTAKGTFMSVADVSQGRASLNASTAATSCLSRVGSCTHHISRSREACRLCAAHWESSCRR